RPPISRPALCRSGRLLAFEGNGMAEATSPIVERRDQDAAARVERVRQAAIAEAPTHRRILRTPRHGQILSALMLPFVLARPSAGYGVLTTTGRRTGKRRRKCIRLIRRDSKVYLVQL